MIRHALLSKCGLYRYTLHRGWGTPGGAHVTFVMLNPSTADAEKDDPTIRRCIGFATRWGFEHLVVVNLFALRATDPGKLVTTAFPKIEAPLGTGGIANDNCIRDAVVTASKTILAWGAHGARWAQRAAVVRSGRGEDRAGRHRLSNRTAHQERPRASAGATAVPAAAGGGAPMKHFRRAPPVIPDLFEVTHV